MCVYSDFNFCCLTPSSQKFSIRCIYPLYKVDDMQFLQPHVLKLLYSKFGVGGELYNSMKGNTYVDLYTHLPKQDSEQSICPQNAPVLTPQSHTHLLLHTLWWLLSHSLSLQFCVFKNYLSRPIFNLLRPASFNQHNTFEIQV